MKEQKKIKGSVLVADSIYNSKNSVWPRNEAYQNRTSGKLPKWSIQIDTKIVHAEGYKNCLSEGVQKPSVQKRAEIV